MLQSSYERPSFTPIRTDRHNLHAPVKFYSDAPIFEKPGLDSLSFFR